MRTKKIVLVSLFAALMAAGAFIKIPIPYVPITMQFFFSAYSGIILGPWLGFFSQLIYIAIGLTGIPVFANGGGPGYVFQPTFGYVLGFAFGSMVSGYVYNKFSRQDFWAIFFSMFAGLMVIYSFGLPYLYLVYSAYLGNPKTVSWVLYWGFCTSIIGDAIVCVVSSKMGARMIPIIKKKIAFE